MNTSAIIPYIIAQITAGSNETLANIRCTCDSCAIKQLRGNHQLLNTLASLLYESMRENLRPKLINTQTSSLIFLYVLGFYGNTAALSLELKSYFKSLT